MAETGKDKLRIKHAFTDVLKIGEWLRSAEIGKNPEETAQEILDRCVQDTGIPMNMGHLQRYCKRLEIRLPKDTQPVALRLESKMEFLRSDLKAAQQRISELEVRLTNLETALGT